MSSALAYPHPLEGEGENENTSKKNAFKSTSAVEMLLERPLTESLRPALLLFLPHSQLTLRCPKSAPVPNTVQKFKAGQNNSPDFIWPSYNRVLRKIDTL